MFIEEIETFNSTETRLMRNLRDVLEIESSNMSEGFKKILLYISVADLII